MKNITIRSRLGEIVGVTDGEVAAFDRFDPKADRIVRHYVLLKESTKLMHEPWGWKDRWYVDLVDIRRIDEDTIELDDLYLDVIVEGNGPTYRMIDMEELADALVDQKVSIETLRGPFHCLQRFLDSHLHGGKDFPPVALQPFYEIELAEPGR